MVSTVVMKRYQMLATMSRAMIWKLRPEMIWDWPNSSLNPTAKASEVVLSIEIVSLPVGGTMTRMAWGNTMRRIDWSRVMPSAEAASTCPSPTDRMPARAISAMYAASLSPRPRQTATNWVINVLGSSVMSQLGPNGMP